MSILERVLPRTAPRPIVVERMRMRHVGQVMEIEKQAYPRSWTAQVFHDELREVRRERRFYVVACRGRIVLGYGGLMFTGLRHGDEAHITNIAVHPDERRTGVATRMMCVLADEAIRRGCVAWTLEVRAPSTGAQELYRRFGFVPAGVRRNYYENDTDAIVMWCNDIQSDDYAARLRELCRG